MLYEQTNPMYIYMYNVLHLYLNLSSSKSTGAPMYLNIKAITFMILLAVSWSCAYTVVQTPNDIESPTPPHNS